MLYNKLNNFRSLSHFIVNFCIFFTLYSRALDRKRYREICEPLGTDYFNELACEPEPDVKNYTLKNFFQREFLEKMNPKP